MSQQPVTVHLKAAPAKPLRFTLDGYQLVPNDFHVTEIKKVSIDSLDCGSARSWQELVVQLWSPNGDDSQRSMAAENFASILTKAHALPLLDGERVRFEYAPTGGPAVQYNLGSLCERADTLEFSLVAPHVACRPQEQRYLTVLVTTQSSGCCSPNAAEGCCA